MQAAGQPSYWNVDGHGTANEFERVILNPRSLGAQHTFSKGAGLAISIAVGIATAGIFQGITALVSYRFSKKNNRVFFKMPDNDSTGVHSAASAHTTAHVADRVLHGVEDLVSCHTPAPPADADVPPVSNDAVPFISTKLFPENILEEMTFSDRDVPLLQNKEITGETKIDTYLCQWDQEGLTNRFSEILRHELNWLDQAKGLFNDT